jgi:hypothetical protein
MKKGQGQGQGFFFAEATKNEKGTGTGPIILAVSLAKIEIEEKYGPGQGQGFFFAEATKNEKGCANRLRARFGLAPTLLCLLSGSNSMKVCIHQDVTLLSLHDGSS